MPRNSRDNNQRGIALLILALVVCGVLSAVHKHAERTHHSDPVTGVVRDVALVPAQTVVVRISRWFHDDIFSLFNGPRLARQNEVLRKRILALSFENKLLADEQAENDRLRALLDFQKRSPKPLIAAEMTALKPTSQSDVVVLNRGAANGVHLHSVVIDPNGALIGQVIDVSSHSCTALMVTDVGSSVGAQVESTAVVHPVGIVKGKGDGMALLTYLQGDSDVEPGDRVTTSGLSDYFPADIPIGTIRTVQIDKTRSMKTAWIHPIADLDHIQEAFILQK